MVELGKATIQNSIWMLKKTPARHAQWEYDADVRAIRFPFDLVKWGFAVSWVESAPKIYRNESKNAQSSHWLVGKLFTGR